MKLTRYFFISDSLDDLERFEKNLEQTEIVSPQMHLLTLDDSGAANHEHLQSMTSFMKKDIIRSTLFGAGIGLCAAILVLIVSYLAGWTQTAAGWMPFIFLAFVVLGFVTWQGGLWGIQKPNVHFDSFEQALNDGKHVFFVDVTPAHGRVLQEIAAKHSAVEAAGSARGAPTWIVFSHHGLKRFFTQTFP